LPDHFLAEALAAEPACAIQRPEDVAIGHSHRRSPSIDRYFDPGGHWDRADAPVFADQIDNAPAAIPLLHVRESQRRNFLASQSAAQKDS